MKLSKEKLERGLKAELLAVLKLERQKQALETLIQNCNDNITKYNRELSRLYKNG